MPTDKHLEADVIAKARKMASVAHAASPHGFCPYGQAIMDVCDGYESQAAALAEARERAATWQQRAEQAAELLELRATAHAAQAAPGQEDAQ